MRVAKPHDRRGQDRRLRGLIGAETTDSHFPQSDGMERREYAPSSKVAQHQQGELGDSPGITFQQIQTYENGIRRSGPMTTVEIDARSSSSNSIG
jgi:hypothetical protein